MSGAPKFDEALQAQLADFAQSVMGATGADLVRVGILKLDGNDHRSLSGVSAHRSSYADEAAVMSDLAWEALNFAQTVLDDNIEVGIMQNGTFSPVSEASAKTIIWG